MIIHILDYVYRSMDPGVRNTASALCKASRECSSSGQHSMAKFAPLATCPQCLEIYETPEPRPMDWVD